METVFFFSFKNAPWQMVSIILRKKWLVYLGIHKGSKFNRLLKFPIKVMGKTAECI